MVKVIFYLCCPQTHAFHPAPSWQATK